MVARRETARGSSPSLPDRLSGYSDVGRSWPAPSRVSPPARITQTRSRSEESPRSVSGNRETARDPRPRPIGTPVSRLACPIPSSSATPTSDSRLRSRRPGRAAARGCRSSRTAKTGRSVSVSGWPRTGARGRARPSAVIMFVGLSTRGLAADRTRTGYETSKACRKAFRTKGRCL